MLQGHRNFKNKVYDFIKKCQQNNLFLKKKMAE